MLGTVGYLSPEQASGLPADHRSDIFSLGAMLFEMVTHRRAFARATAAQTLAAVLEEDPTASIAVAAGTSARVMNLVRRCLDKSLSGDLQSARDLALVLANEVGGNDLSDLSAACLERRPLAWMRRPVQVRGAACARHGAVAAACAPRNGRGAGMAMDATDTASRARRKYALMSSHHQRSIRMHGCRSRFRQTARSCRLSHRWMAPTSCG